MVNQNCNTASTSDNMNGPSLFCLYIDSYFFLFVSFHEMNLSFPGSSNITQQKGFSEKTVYAGSRGILACNSSSWNSDASLIIWYKGITGLPLSTLDLRSGSKSSSVMSVNKNRAKDKTARYYIDTSSLPPVLVIEPVQEEDTGNYRCRIDYLYSRTRNYVVKLNVIGKLCLTKVYFKPNTNG